MTSINDLPLEFEKVRELLECNKNPVVISFVNPDGRLVATPVWTYYNPKDGLFYLFSSKNAVKVKAIKVGKKEFTLTIINEGHYVVVDGTKVPYLSMTGEMEIITSSEVENINELHILLLEKYNIEGQQSWVGESIARLKANPSDTWMLRFKPHKISYYRH